MTTDQRRAAENGIWLCQLCSRSVDSNDPKFTEALLKEWKRRSNADSWRSVMQGVPYVPGMAPTPDELAERLRVAAAADLALFKQTAKWPGTAVALTLKIDRIDEPLSTRALAVALTTFDDLILVAAPGMGKTTTVFQVAEHVLEIGNGIPLIVPLGDWATENEPLLTSILKRSNYAQISEVDFRVVASKSGVVMLLDGWNELDDASRERARKQIAKLKVELPEIGLLLSTRRQALDVPFGGTRIDLLPLGDEQQMAIARSMRGEAGERLVDQAWRTAGIRELVTIPLYLTALLSLPDGAPFPRTKDEVLGRFVAAQEQDEAHSAALRSVAGGFQQNYMEGLAILATSTANTSLGEADARRSIGETTRLLIDDGQLSTAIAQPADILNTLVSNHVLMHAGDTTGYSFQHQQFQEWYASHAVESVMLEVGGDAAARERLKAVMLNFRPWTEAILFAVERASRGNDAQKAACSSAIIAAFEVDPILAAEMIFRATDDVWSPIASTIRGFVDRWHAPGKLDRAVRFMITSGRAEFGDLLWPLLTHQNDQVHLAAMRAANQFRPSVFGSDAAGRISQLPAETRRNVLHEIASHSGMEGLDLATEIAIADSDPEVKALLVDALTFRRADRHVAAVLKDADDATYDIVVRKGHIDEVPDGVVRERLEAARARRAATETSPREQLYALVNGGPEVSDEQIASLVAELEIDRQDTAQSHLLYEVRQRFPKALADGILRRVLAGRELFYGADDILAAGGFSLEDDALLELAMGEARRHDDRAEAAASALGPVSVGKLVDAYLEARQTLRLPDGRFDQAASDRHSALRDRIGHTPGASLITAVQARADTIADEQVAHLAALFSRDALGPPERARPFSQDGLVAVGVLAQKWGTRLLETNVSRAAKATIATMISHAPSGALLPVLQRLLDDNLSLYAGFRDRVNANGRMDRDAMQEAQSPHLSEYQFAFTAIKGAECDELVAEYLTDQHFGESAARVLLLHWMEINQPKSDKIFFGGVDFSQVEKRRAARAANLSESCAEADKIFAAIGALIEGVPSTDQTRLAVTLGCIGSLLPHGQRDGIIANLIALAPRRSRARLLLSLVLAGEPIDIGLVEQGIAETFQAAETERWILQQDNPYELKEWLSLLPFSNPISELPRIVRGMPEEQRNPRLLEEMVRGLGATPEDGAEAVLFDLAEGDPRFYQDHEWRSTALRFGTASAALRLIDLRMSDTMNGGSSDGWRLQGELSGLIAEHPEARAYVRTLLKDGVTTAPLAYMAQVLAEKPEPEDVMLLVKAEQEYGRSFLGSRSIESAITAHVPSEHWHGAYDVVPLPAPELRQGLLALTLDGNADDPAARCLNEIDKLRDRYGAPETEPRHPNLASGRPWPILAPDPDAEDAN